MKKPSSILRTLSSFRPTSSAQWFPSPVVTPLPEQTPFDQQMTVHLHNLNQRMEHLQQVETYTKDGTINTTTWLLNLLDATITSQKLTQDCLPLNRDNLRGSEAVDLYLEENVELLDSCNVLLEQVEAIRSCVDSLRIAIHLLDQGGCLKSGSLARVQRLLDTSKLEGWKKTSRPIMRKLVTVQSSDHVFEEALSGSKSLTAFTLCILSEFALPIKKSTKKNSSFGVMKSRRPTTALSYAFLQLQNSVAEKKQLLKKGSNFFMVPELRDMVNEAHWLRDQLAKADSDYGTMIRIHVEGLRRSCDELEQVVLDGFESRVKDLYRELISVRMALL